MVIPVGPGKFYDSSLPRPRYFTNVTFNSERVDPAALVLDPLLSWANEAHWSMGGLSFKRLRLKGRIEGKVNDLRAEREKIAKQQHRTTAEVADAFIFDGEAETKFEISNLGVSATGPIATKRRRFMPLFDEEEEEIEEVAEKRSGGDRRKPVRKLGTILTELSRRFRPRRARELIDLIGLGAGDRSRTL